MGFDHFEAHVIEEILHEMQHLMPQIGRAVGLGQERFSLSATSASTVLVGTPDIAQQPFDVLDVEQESKEHLVSSQAVAIDHERDGPFDVVVERERLQAGQFVLHGFIRGVDQIDVDHPFEHRDEIVVEHLDAHVVLVVIVGRDGQRDVEQRLNLVLVDVSRQFSQLVLRRVHELHDVIALVDEKVVLQRFEPLNQMVLVQDEVQEDLAGVLVGLFETLVEILLVHRVLELLVVVHEQLLVDAKNRRGHVHVHVVVVVEGTLANGIEVLAGVEDHLRRRLKEDRRVVSLENVTARPELVVVFLLEAALVMDDVLVLLHHEFAVRIIDQAIVNPGFEHGQVRFVGRLGEKEADVVGLLVSG